LSVQVLAVAYIGGIGTLTGSLIAGFSAVGGIFNKILDRFFELGDMQPLILSVMMLSVVALHPEGFDSVIKLWGRGLERLWLYLVGNGRGNRPRGEAQAQSALVPESPPDEVRSGSR